MKSSYSCLLIPWLAACGGDDAGGSPDEIEPCAIVTQADATELFGAVAERDQGTLVSDPDYLGDCVWTYEPPGLLGSQNVALNLWQGEAYYSPRAEAVPFQIGDGGSIYQSQSTGIDIDWLQGGKTAMLSYFNVGAGVPDALTKLDEVKALALKASNRL